MHVRAKSLALTHSGHASQQIGCFQNAHFEGPGLPDIWSVQISSIVKAPSGGGAVGEVPTLRGARDVRSSTGSTAHKRQIADFFDLKSKIGRRLKLIWDSQMSFRRRAFLIANRKKSRKFAIIAKREPFFFIEKKKRRGAFLEKDSNENVAYRTSAEVGGFFP